MIPSCFILQEILCIDIPWGGGLDQNLPIGTGVGLGNRAPGKSLFQLQWDLFEAYQAPTSKGCKIFFSVIKEFKGLLLFVALKKCLLTR